jgi:hypothetical protein
VPYYKPAADEIAYHVKTREHFLVFALANRHRLAPCKREKLDQLLAILTDHIDQRIHVLSAQ